MTEVDVVLSQEAFTCRAKKTLLLAEVVTRTFPNNRAKKKVFHSKLNSTLKFKTRSSFSSRRPDYLSKKKKNCRKRKWKPYCKLNWVERQQLEERDSRRALRIREEMTANGLTLAPYNTTQFLIEDHNVQEPDYKAISNGFRNNNNLEEFYISPEDEEEFLQKEFVQTYEDLHAERMRSLSKSDLVEEFVGLEDKVEELKNTLQEARLHKTPKDRTPIRPAGFDVAAELEKIHVFREEIEKLTLENDFLDRENEILRLRLSRKTKRCPRP